MPEWPYIIAAYVASWVVLGGFAIYLVLRDRAALRQFRDRNARRA